MVGERAPGTVVDEVRQGHVEDAEARAEDDRVHFRAAAVGAEHGAAVDCADGAGVQVHIRAGQGRVVVVGEQDALAADGVVGGQLAAQFTVADGGAQVCACHRLYAAQQ